MWRRSWRLNLRRSRRRLWRRIGARRLRLILHGRQAGQGAGGIDSRDRGVIPLAIGRAIAELEHKAQFACQSIVFVAEFHICGHAIAERRARVGEILLQPCPGHCFLRIRRQSLQSARKIRHRACRRQDRRHI